MHADMYTHTRALGGGPPARGVGEGHGCAGEPDPANVSRRVGVYSVRSQQTLFAAWSFSGSINVEPFG